MTQLQTIRRDVPCNVWKAEPAHVDHLGKGPRSSTDSEVRAYFDWLRRRADLPDMGKVYLDGGKIGETRGRYAPVCRGATFGTMTSPARGEYVGEGEARTYVQTEEQWADGSYSIAMPGYRSKVATVTMETLDEAGEVVTTSTLPVEPKKGGIVWSREAVREAHGPVPKSAKPKRARKVSPPVEEAASVPHETSAPPEPLTAPKMETAVLQPEAPETLSAPASADGAGNPQLYALFAIVEEMQGQIAALQAATKPEVETRSEVAAADPLPRAKRTASHERAIRRAWSERRARRELAVHLRIGQAQFDAIREDNRRIPQLQSALLERGAELARATARRRANALFARKRTRELVAAVNHMHTRLDGEIAARERLEFDREELIAKVATLELEAKEPRALYQAELDRMNARCVWLENREIERLSGGRIRLNMQQVEPAQTLDATALAG